MYQGCTNHNSGQAVCPGVSDQHKMNFIGGGVHFLFCHFLPYCFLFVCFDFLSFLERDRVGDGERGKTEHEVG